MIQLSMMSVPYLALCQVLLKIESKYKTVPLFRELTVIQDINMRNL